MVRVLVLVIISGGPFGRCLFPFDTYKIPRYGQVIYTKRAIHNPDTNTATPLDKQTRDERRDGIHRSQRPRTRNENEHGRTTQRAKQDEETGRASGINRPAYRQARRGERRDARMRRRERRDKDDERARARTRTTSPRPTTSTTRRGRSNGNGASKRIAMRQVIDNINNGC